MQSVPQRFGLRTTSLQVTYTHFTRCFFYQENHEWRGSSHPNSARSMSFHSILIRKRQFLLKFQLLGNKLLLDQFIDNQKQIKKNNLIS